ncbi:MAG: type IV toxin-antitoxin system AbiEi family antitoxin domain-containing protein [Parachlamydiales bacterium]
MPELLGIGKHLRSQLSHILAATGGVVTPTEVAQTLGVAPREAANILGRLAARGWIRRIRRGLYVPIPLEALVDTGVIEEPWVVADRLFAPCYIGGWSAAHHWGLTDQLFITTLVVTVKKASSRDQRVGEARFLLKRTKPDRLFGLELIRLDRVPVLLSDPTRTIIDILNDPTLAGGILSAFDMLEQYFRSEHRDLKRLIEYGDRLGNGTVFKRLGFLTEYLMPDSHELIKACQKRITKGYSQVEPGLEGGISSAKWRLHISEALRGWITS